MACKVALEWKNSGFYLGENKLECLSILMVLAYY